MPAVDFESKTPGILDVTSLIARFMGPKWDPSGADRTQVGLMLAPRSLVSGSMFLHQILYHDLWYLGLCSCTRSCTMSFGIWVYVLVPDLVPWSLVSGSMFLYQILYHDLWYLGLCSCTRSFIMSFGIWVYVLIPDLVPWSLVSGSMFLYQILYHELWYLGLCFCTRSCTMSFGIWVHVLLPNRTPPTPPPAKDFCSRDNFRTTLRIWVFKVNYEICYVSAKYDPFATAWKASRSIPTQMWSSSITLTLNNQGRSI